MNTGDTAWMLVSAALVIFMVPGLALFYGGLGRQVVLAVVGLAYPFVLTWIVLWVTHQVVGLRVGSDEQAEGLDLGEYGEVGYALVPALGAPGVGALPSTPKESKL